MTSVVFCAQLLFLLGAQTGKIKHCCTLCVDWSCISWHRVSHFGLGWQFRSQVYFRPSLQLILLSRLEATCLALTLFTNTWLSFTNCFDLKLAWWDHVHSPFILFSTFYFIFWCIDCFVFHILYPLCLISSLLLFCFRLKN